MFEIKIEKFYPDPKKESVYIELKEPSYVDNQMFLESDGTSDFGPNKKWDQMTPQQKEALKKQNEISLQLLKKCIVSFRGFFLKSEEITDVNVLIENLPSSVMMPLQAKLFEMSNLGEKEVKK